MTDDVRQLLKGHLAALKALSNAMDRALTGADVNMWRFVGFRDYMVKYQSIVEQVAKVVQINVPITLWDLSKVKGMGDTIGLVQKQLFDGVYSNVLLLAGFIEHIIGLHEDEIRALADFFQANLRRAVFETPKREKDIQDTIEQLLIGRGLNRGIDYEREKGRVKVSIKEVVPDFVIRRLSLALEIKLLRDKAAARASIDEINADIQAYGKHYRAIIFIVYDLGSIQDELEFKQGLAALEQNIHVVIVKQ